MPKAYQWIRARVSLRIWAWMHAFLALGLGWGHAISIYPPTSYDGVLDLTLVFRMGVLTAIGSIGAVVGMLMTRSQSQRTQHKGLWVELVGTVLMAGGPLQYWSIQLGYIAQGEFDQRYALMWFAYAMCSFMLVRYSILIPAIIKSSRKARAQERGLRP